MGLHSIDGGLNKAHSGATPHYNSSDPEQGLEFTIRQTGGLCAPNNVPQRSLLPGSKNKERKERRKATGLSVSFTFPRGFLTGLRSHCR